MRNITVALYADGLVKPFPAYTFNSSYPILYYVKSMDTLCADCATKQYERDTWGESYNNELIGCDVYYEGPVVYCGHCQTEIEAAYGDPECNLAVFVPRNEE